MSYLGFLAAKAMPDGALAVAIDAGNDDVVLMRLYTEQLTLARHVESVPDFRSGLMKHRLVDETVDADFKFLATDWLIISRSEFDEATYQTRIPAYARQLPAPSEGMPA